MSKLSESQKTEIKEMIADKLCVDIEEVKDDSNFVNDLGADSLDEVELIMNLEKIHDIYIPDDEAEEAHIVSDFYNIVERHIQ